MPARGLLLLSGGIDSPVAGYLAEKQSEIIALHLSNEMFSGTESIEKVEKISKKLKFKKLIVLDVSEQLKEIAEKANHRLYFVLQRRFFMRLASLAAKKEKCDFILTGDSLGQVSSQTLANMGVISRAASIPVARPLLGFNKQETTDLANEIGTFEISRGPEMCDVLGPKHPSTKAELKNVEAEEKKIGLNELAEKAFYQIK